MSSADHFPYSAGSPFVVCYKVQCFALGEFFLVEFEFYNTIICVVVTNVLGDM